MNVTGLQRVAATIRSGDIIRTADGTEHAVVGHPTTGRTTTGDLIVTLRFEGGGILQVSAGAWLDVERTRPALALVAATVTGCERCAYLEAGFKDPSTPNPGVFLYGWATHLLDDHGETATPRTDCPECQRFAAEPAAIRRSHWDRWAAIHFLKCRLAPRWSPGG